MAVGRAMRGRPYCYSNKRAGEFCAAIAEGRTVQEAAQAIGVRSPSTIFIWLVRHETFAAMYLAAQRVRAFVLAEEMLHIADTPQMASQTKVRGEVSETVEVEMTAHRKLQIDTRKWLLAKLNPRDFGPGAGAEAPAPATGDSGLRVLSAVPITDEEWRIRYGPDLGAAGRAAAGAD